MSFRNVRISPTDEERKRYSIPAGVDIVVGQDVIEDEIERHSILANVVCAFAEMYGVDIRHIRGVAWALEDFVERIKQNEEKNTHEEKHNDRTAA